MLASLPSACLVGIEIARLAQPAVVTVDIDQLENGLSIIEKIAKHSAESAKKASAVIA